MAFCIEPLLRRLPGGRGGDAYRQALARSAKYFNTHPFFAGLAVGAVARAEHDHVAPDRVVRLRAALKGSLGAIGDRLIWAGVLPCASALAAIVAIELSPLASVIVFLVVFNLVHLTIRLWAVPSGWRLGTAVAEALQSKAIVRGAAFFGRAAVGLVGLAVPIVTDALLVDFDLGTRVGALLVAVVAGVCFRWLTPTLGAARFGVVAIGVGLVVGWLWP